MDRVGSRRSPCVDDRRGGPRASGGMVSSKGLAGVIAASSGVLVELWPAGPDLRHLDRSRSVSGDGSSTRAERGRRGLHGQGVGVRSAACRRGAAGGCAGGPAACVAQAGLRGGRRPRVGRVASIAAVSAAGAGLPQARRAVQREHAQARVRVVGQSRAVRTRAAAAACVRNAAEPRRDAQSSTGVTRTADRCPCARRAR